MASPESQDSEIDRLERGLLLEGEGEGESESESEEVLYTASFKETEDNYVKYQTAVWVLYSLLLILAWGIGLFMFIYLPARRYILRKDIRSRKLYLTSNAIVYKVKRPERFPCLGVLKKEKHVLLPSVSDVVVEQGYLQSLFGVYSVRIENTGVRRPPSDDVQIQGIANPNAFRKAVLNRLSKMKSEISSPAMRDVGNIRVGISSATKASPSKSLRLDSFQSAELILQKLEEVGSSVKRVQTLMEEQEQHSQTS